MIQRNFSKTILLDKINEELSHIEIFNDVEQHVVKGTVLTTINFTEEPSYTIDVEVQAIVDAHIPNYPIYKVDQYIDRTFRHLPFYKIDFTQHLEKNVVFSKSVTKDLRGRPLFAEYRYKGEVMCRIEWEFTDSSGGLYKKKKQFLIYIQEDGTDGERFLIKESELDFTVPNQLSESIKEREDARDSIVGEIKAVCSGAIQVSLGLSLEDVIVLIKPFWDEYKKDRDNFVELATQDWFIDVLSLSGDDYPWLDIPVNASGTTCKEYILYRLGY